MQITMLNWVVSKFRMDLVCSKLENWASDIYFYHINIFIFSFCPISSLQKSVYQNKGSKWGAKKCMAVTASLFKYTGVSRVSHFIHLNVSHVYLCSDFEIVQKNVIKASIIPTLNFLRMF